MDLLSPGIAWYGSKRASKAVLRDINLNSAIALRLLNQARRVNASAKSLVQCFSTDRVSQNAPLATAHAAFIDLFYSLGLDNLNPKTIFNADLDTLARIYHSIGDFAPLDLAGETRVAAPSNESDASPSPTPPDLSDSQLRDHTLALITYFVLIVAATHLSNDLIYSSLRIKSNLVYWDSIHASLPSKLCYFVQTMPLRVASISTNIYRLVAKKLASPSAPGLNSQYSRSPRQRIASWVSWTWSFSMSSLKHVSYDFFPAIALLQTTSSQQSPFQWYRQALSSIVRSPIRIVNADIKRHSKAAQTLLNTNASAIDSLLSADNNSLQSMLAVLAPLTGTDPSLSPQQQTASILNATISSNRYPRETAASPPSFLTRYWPLLLLVARYGPSQTLSAYTNRTEIAQWIKLNLVDTCVGFVSNWLIKPLGDMLKVLRSDSDITLTTKESLDSDLDSLERMVADYVADSGLANVPRQQIHQEIRNGDLTRLMSQYEADLRQPLLSIVKGSLVRALLIQVQKTRVDGGVALNGIDKLLKSQQLVFGVVSVSPSLFIVYSLWNWLTASKPLMVNGKQVNLVCVKALSDIENLLVLSKHINSDHVAYQGRLLVEVVNLIIVSRPLVPHQLRRDWVRDLNDLTSNDYENDAKLALMRKIWNVYGPYFR